MAPQHERDREERRAPTRAAVVLASLPTREELGGRLGSIADRLDEIASACQEEGATALSISSLDKMRLAIESIARVAGMTGGGSPTQVNVQVNLSAHDIGSSIASHLNTLKPQQAVEVLELMADE